MLICQSSRDRPAPERYLTPEPRTRTSNRKYLHPVGAMQCPVDRWMRQVLTHSTNLSASKTDKCPCQDPNKRLQSGRPRRAVKWAGHGHHCPLSEKSNVTATTRGAQVKSYRGRLTRWCDRLGLIPTQLFYFWRLYQVLVACMTRP